MSEQFNPYNYESLTDLPEDQQTNFKLPEDGQGFVKETVVDNIEVAHDQAITDPESGDKEKSGLEIIKILPSKIVAYENVIDKIFHNENGIIVLINYIGQTQHSPEGYQQAIERAKSGRPTLILGWMSQEAMSSDAGFISLMGYPNVRYLRLPGRLTEISDTLRGIPQEEKQPDPLAQELYKLQSRQSEMRVVQHDLRNAVRGNDPARTADLITRARNLGYDGSDQEIIQTVANWKNDGERHFEGRSFEDVCVDIEGTLITPEGEINEAVRQAVENRGQNRPITVWTGGDVSKYDPILRKAGITWKLIPKQSMAGAEVAIAIDDLAQEEFERMYQVKVKEYIQVGELENLAHQSE